MTSPNHHLRRPMGTIGQPCRCCDGLIAAIVQSRPHVRYQWMEIAHEAYETSYAGSAHANALAAPRPGFEFALWEAASLD